MRTRLMPVVFISHGAPDALLNAPDAVSCWREMGETLPDPSAILVITARGCRCRRCIRAPPPVTQLSLIRHGSPAQHYALGQALAPLRDEGVLIVATGAITHNFGWLDWRNAAARPVPQAQVFADWVAAQLDAQDVSALMAYRSAPGGAAAHPAKSASCRCLSRWARRASGRGGRGVAAAPSAPVQLRRPGDGRVCVARCLYASYGPGGAGRLTIKRR